MATIYKCDKCKKIIKDECRKASISWWSGFNIGKNGGWPSNIVLCENCFKPFTLIIRKFLNIK